MLGSACPSHPEPSEGRGSWLLDAANIPVVAVAVLMVLVMFVLLTIEQAQATVQKYIQNLPTNAGANLTPSLFRPRARGLRQCLQSSWR
jgi:hypothetical protein